MNNGKAVVLVVLGLSNQELNACYSYKANIVPLAIVVDSHMIYLISFPENTVATGKKVVVPVVLVVPSFTQENQGVAVVVIVLVLVLVPLVLVLVLEVVLVVVRYRRGKEKEGVVDEAEGAAGVVVDVVAGGSSKLHKKSQPKLI